MEYIKYLIKNPKKLFFLLGCLLFEFSILYGLIIDRESIIQDNSPFIYYSLIPILLFTIGTTIYQPYKEWKDVNKSN